MEFLRVLCGMDVIFGGSKTLSDLFYWLNLLKFSWVFKKFKMTSKKTLFEKKVPVSHCQNFTNVTSNFPSKTQKFKTYSHSKIQNFIHKPLISSASTPIHPKTSQTTSKCTLWEMLQHAGLIFHFYVHCKWRGPWQRKEI